MLQDYGALSGQICNADKSHIFFGKGADNVTKRRINRALGFIVGTLPFSYLGVPLFCGRPLPSHFEAARDRILSKFSSWKGKHLSMAGRICLVQSVIQSSTVHSMLIYKWPKTIVAELDVASRNFIWSGDKSVRSSCVVSWAKVCSLKEEGGLGLRSFQLINDGLLMKMAWKVIAGEGFGFNLMRDRYLDSHLRPKRAGVSSSIWRSIHHLVRELSEDTYCFLGDGSSVLFWLDDWLGYRLVDKLSIPEFMHTFLSHSVSDYYYDGSWHFSLDFVMTYPLIVFDIIRTPIKGGRDLRYWKLSLHGVVTPRLAYFSRCLRVPTVKWGSWIWAKYIPVRRSLVCWRLIHAKLPTADFWLRRGIAGPSICSLCAEEEETLNHLFWSCRVARVIWYMLLNWFGMIREIDQPDFNSFLVKAMQASFSPQLSHLWKVGVISMVWIIWKARNDAMWRDIHWNTYSMMVQIQVMLKEANSHHSLGYMHNSWRDLISLRALGVNGNQAPPKKMLHCSWVPPPSGWIKVNTDGSVRGSPGVIHAGGVFRDYRGIVVGCYHVSGGIGFAFEAELLAAIWAIERAHWMGWHALWLESDSSYVVGLLSTRSWRVPWRFVARWTKTLDRLQDMDFRVSHIFREGNTVADILAGPSISEGWWSDPIQEIRDAVQRDMSCPRFYRFK